MAVDLIPLSQLPNRYDIARSNLYNRLKDLKIEPIKQALNAVLFILTEKFKKSDIYRLLRWQLDMMDLISSNT